MAKDTYLGRVVPRAVKFPVSLSAADGRLVRERVEQLGLKGPSEFFQRLLHQGMGARLAVVIDPPAIAGSVMPAAPQGGLRASA